MKNFSKIFFFIFFFISSLSFAENFKHVPLAIGVNSQISDGKYSLEEIIKEIKNNDFKIIIFTDFFLRRWEYGLWPFRKILKKKVEEPSIFSFGINNYLKKIEDLQKENPSLILIPGTEVSPFYYWQGSPFKKNFSLNNWHKHFLIFGLENKKDYRFLPVIGNNLALYLPFRLKNLVKFWPLIFIFLGFLLFKRFFLSVIFFSLGFLFFIENFPFLDLKFNQYKDFDLIPYQNLINYVDEKKGLVFWAHPEAENIEKISNVLIKTKNHSEDLIFTSDYTGFSIFYEGYRNIGKIGGIWDNLLYEYCQGKRKKPVWAIASLGFDRNGKLSDYLKDLRNIVLLKKFDKKEVISALKKGRVYILRGSLSSNFILEDFSVENAFGEKRAIGDKLVLKDIPKINIKGYFKDNRKRRLKIKLIKQKKLLFEFEKETPFEIEYLDLEKHKNETVYYRLEIIGENLHLISNPIFVERKESN